MRFLTGNQVGVSGENACFSKLRLVQIVCFHSGHLIFCSQFVEIIENAIVLELILRKGDVVIKIEITAF